MAGAELSRDFVHFEREASFLREYCGFVHPNLAQEAMPWANYDYALKSLLSVLHSQLSTKPTGAISRPIYNDGGA